MDKKTPENCRWAQPTLFLQHPDWLEACDMPWTCRRDGLQRVLDSTEVCAECPRWESRPQRPAVAWDFGTGAVKR